jgi:hypothetical protein
MEFHDSWLLDMLHREDGTGWVLFRGSVYRSNGTVFADEQESGYQNVRFEFEGMRVEGEIVELGQHATGGEFWVDGKNQNGVMRLPIDQSGEIRFELCLAPEFRTVQIHATHVRSSFEGQFELEFHWDREGNTRRPEA